MGSASDEALYPKPYPARTHLTEPLSCLPRSYINCTFFRSRVGFQSKALYGTDAVSTPDDSVVVAGRHAVDLPLVPISGGNDTAGCVPWGFLWSWACDSPRPPRLCI